MVILEVITIITIISIIFITGVISGMRYQNNHIDRIEILIIIMIFAVAFKLLNLMPLNINRNIENAFNNSPIYIDKSYNIERSIYSSAGFKYEQIIIKISNDLEDTYTVIKLNKEAFKKD